MLFSVAGKSAADSSPLCLIVSFEDLYAAQEVTVSRPRLRPSDSIAFNDNAMHSLLREGRAYTCICNKDEHPKPESQSAAAISFIFLGFTDDSCCLFCGINPKVDDFSVIEFYL